MTQVTSKNMEVPMNINKKGKFFVKSHLKQMSVIKSAHNHRQCLYNNIRITQNSWKTSESEAREYQGVCSPETLYQVY